MGVSTGLRIEYIDPGDRETMREALRLVNKTFYRDTVSEELFRRAVIEDPNNVSDSIAGAYRGSSLVGIVVRSFFHRSPPTVPDTSRGVLYIKLLAVDHSLSSLYEEVLRLLVEDSIEMAMRRGLSRIRVGGYPVWYVFPGIEISYEGYTRYLEKTGFRKVREVVNYEIDTTEFYYPERVSDIEKRLEREAFSVRRAGVSDTERVLGWVRDRFGVFWEYETRLALGREGSGVLVAEKTSSREIVGFAVYSGICRERFGPIGVAEEYRRSGIGTVLLFKALLEMRLGGTRIVEIPWTDHLFFYTQVPGIRRVRHFVIYEKSV